MTPKTIRWIRWGVVSMLVLAVAALAIGRVGSKPRTKSEPANAAAVRSVVNGPTMSGTLSGQGPVPAPASGTTTDSIASGLPDTSDRIERTADLTVEVKKGTFDAQWTAAYKVAQHFGGQIMSSTRGVPSPLPVPLEQNATVSGTHEPAIGDITIRIPSQNFVNASNALRALGIVRGDTTTTQDVSQEYVDLQSRQRNLRAEQNVLLGLFARSKTIKDTLAVQAELSNVEGQIEQITGRINYLDAHTSFSTITVHLQEPGVTVIATVHEGPSLGGAWDTAKTGLVRLAGAAMIFALWAIPFAVLGFIAFGIWRRARRPAPQV